MDRGVKTKTLCWNCYKATNGKWCPFVNNVNNVVDGWKIEVVKMTLYKRKREEYESIVVRQCPLYIYDYDLPRIKQFLEAENIPPKDIEKRLQSIKQRMETYKERNDMRLSCYFDYYKDVRLYQTYESSKSTEQLSEEYVNGDK